MSEYGGFQLYVTTEYKERLKYEFIYSAQINLYVYCDIAESFTKYSRG
jgi:hypothetical protein